MTAPETFFAGPGMSQRLLVANAPEEIVEEEKEKREEALARKAKIAEALQRLKDST